MDIRLAVTGFGNVGQGLALLLDRHGEDYVNRYGARLLLTGVVDRSGAAVDPTGLTPSSLTTVKRERKELAHHELGVAGLNGDHFLERAKADILIEAASTNFVDAEPGWTYVQRALDRSMDVVLASKGSLALHFGEMMHRAREVERNVLYSATVGAPVPALELADRVLTGTEILSFEGIFNGTTHQILTAMAAGSSYDDGVRQAQQMGIAETDPTLDVDGWDAAAKVVIVANTVFGANFRIEDVRRQGIREIQTADIEAAAAKGQVIKLIGRARRSQARIDLEVLPEARGISDALGRLRGDDMGIVYHTEPLGEMACTIHSAGHGGGISTAMTVLRDVFNLARDRGWTTRL